MRSGEAATGDERELLALAPRCGQTMRMKHCGDGMAAGTGESGEGEGKGLKRLATKGNRIGL